MCPRNKAQATLFAATDTREPPILGPPLIYYRGEWNWEKEDNLDGASGDPTWN
jgi:hypothetical protein